MKARVIGIILTLIAISTTAGVNNEIKLSKKNIAEASAVGTRVGDLYMSDLGVSSDVSFKISEDSPNKDFFGIESNQLISKVVFDYEINNTYILLIVGKWNETTYKQKFEIQIIDRKVIRISNNNILENQPIRTFITDMSPASYLDKENYSYRLSNRQFDADNDRFIIEGNNIFSNHSFNHETKDLRELYVDLLSNGHVIDVEKIRIQIKNEEETPTNIRVKNNTFYDTDITRNPVSWLSTVDEDKGDTFTYTLEEPEETNDNHLFSITKNELYAKAQPEKGQQVFRISVRSTDRSGLYIIKEFEVYRLDTPVDLIAMKTALLPVCDGIIDKQDPWNPDLWTHTTNYDLSPAFRARFQLLHTDKNLLLAIEVDDTSMYVANESNGDCTYLYFLMDSYAPHWGEGIRQGTWFIYSYRDQFSDKENNYHSGWSMTDGQGFEYNLNPLTQSTDFHFGTTKSNKGYIQEFILPKEILAANSNFDDESIRFQLKIFDGSSRYHHSYWKYMHDYAIEDLTETGFVKLSNDYITNTSNTNIAPSAYAYINSNNLIIKNTQGSISIFNNNGRKMLSAFIEEDTPINIESLPEGIYIVKGEKLTSRFIK